MSYPNEIDERLNKTLHNMSQEVGYLQAINYVMDLIINNTCNSYNVSKLSYKR